jgi:hypothetical protein
VDRRDPLAVEMLPDADFAQEVGVRRADRVDARVPAGCRFRRVVFDKGDLEAGVAQRTGQRESGQTAADDYEVKLHRG